LTIQNNQIEQKPGYQRAQSDHSSCQTCVFQYYRAFQGFGQAKFAYGGSILGSSQVHTAQLPLKTLVHLKVVKIDLKLIILFH